MDRYKHAHLTRCANCSFVFTRRQPTQEELIEHYSDYQRELTISPVTIKRYCELLSQFEQYRKTNRILDVGCGSGHFLEQARHMGWEVHGTEFTEEAMNICMAKGIEMSKGTLNVQDYPNASFDVITSFEVVEHIDHPQEEMLSFYNLLRKGGLLYITTPNFNSLGRLLRKQQYNVIEYPEHLCYYTKRTIRRLLCQHGFSPLKITTTGINFKRIKASAANQANTTSTGTSDETLRDNIEASASLRGLKYMANTLLNITSLGDALKVWAKKPGI